MDAIQRARLQRLIDEINGDKPMSMETRRELGALQIFNARVTTPDARTRALYDVAEAYLFERSGLPLETRRLIAWAIRDDATFIPRYITRNDPITQRITGITVAGDQVGVNMGGPGYNLGGTRYLYLHQLRAHYGEMQRGDDRPAPPPPPAAAAVFYRVHDDDGERSPQKLRW